METLFILKLGENSTSVNLRFKILVMAGKRVSGPEKDDKSFMFGTENDVTRHRNDLNVRNICFVFEARFVFQRLNILSDSNSSRPFKL